MMITHAWRGVRSTIAPAPASALTYVEANTIGVLGLLLLVGMLPDVIMRHLMVAARYQWINYLLDLLEVVTTLWVCGLFGTMVARPHEVGPTHARFQLGALASVDVPFEAIAEVVALPKDADRRALKRGDRGAAFLSAPGTRLVRVDLTEPVTVSKYPFLFAKSSRRLYVASDRPVELRVLLEQRTGYNQPGS